MVASLAAVLAGCSCASKEHGVQNFDPKAELLLSFRTSDDLARIRNRYQDASKKSGQYETTIAALTDAVAAFNPDQDKDVGDGPDKGERVAAAIQAIIDFATAAIKDIGASGGAGFDSPDLEVECLTKLIKRLRELEAQKAEWSDISAAVAGYMLCAKYNVIKPK